MTILGIETSCDETAIAIVEGKTDHVELKTNVLATSLALHAKTGGIIPEQAAREQIKYILPTLKKALDTPDTFDTLKQIDAIAVTYGPGLIGSLLVGVETAKTLAFVLNKPIIPVNHMVGHIYANFIRETREQGTGNRKNQNTSLVPDPYSLVPTFPLLALVVSGGHTDLLLMKNHGDFKLLGGTRDDAAGECFDKSARLLGYPYPGGPKISQLAEKGNPKAFAFPRPMLGSHDYGFSFSGLKTAFLNATREHFPILRTSDKTIGWQQIILENKLSTKEKQTVYDLCASLQQAIVTVLVRKTLKAAQEYKVKSILLSGGVSANQLLQEQFEENIKQTLPETQLFFPEKSLCTDNGAMIASAAYFNFNPMPWKDITADPELYF